MIPSSGLRETFSDHSKKKEEGDARNVYSLHDHPSILVPLPLAIFGDLPFNRILSFLNGKRILSPLGCPYSDAHVCTNEDRNLCHIKYVKLYICILALGMTLKE